MANIRIDELIFDEYNEEEMLAHAITIREARQAFLNGYELLKNAKRHSAEYLMVGQTNGRRWITMPIARTGLPGHWRPATAYPTKSSEKAKLKGRLK